MLAAGLLAAAPVCVHADATGQLASYVAIPDTSYTWREVRSMRLGKTDLTELVLTSQTWRGIPWKHQLIILRPSTLESGSTQAFLFIHGGRWKPEYENGQTKLPREARIFTKLAETLRAPVAVLRHVPFQPLFHRRQIAHTFCIRIVVGVGRQFIESRLVLPFSRSDSNDCVEAIRGTEAEFGLLRLL